MPSDDSGNKSDQLKSLINKFLEAERSGEAFDGDLLIQQHPELADELREFFADHGHDSLAMNSPARSFGDSRESSPEDTPTLASSESESVRVGDEVRYFGDYELLEEIARGGMGAVYKARQRNLNRLVALKMILAGEFAGEDEVSRFKTEAEAAAQLDHPGIVPVFEIGEHNGQHYFSMGYVAGESLAHRLRDGPITSREAAQLLAQICEAVSYAHEKGVVHRDLKPGNVLLDEDGGTPRVTDFGLAKQIGGDSDLTRTGQVLGTPSYMPPEQASGKLGQVGPLADVYALGAMLYAMLTGRPPFQAATSVETLLQSLEQDPVSPRALNSKVPVDLETICLKCLSKDPKRRYSSAAGLGEELRRFLRSQPIHARPVGRIERGRRWCTRNPGVASFAAALVVALVTGTAVSTYFAIESKSFASVALANELEARMNESRAEMALADAETERDRTSEANERLEATLARSKYFLAQARWDDGLTAEALAFLDEIPANQRHLEWYLARSQYLGGGTTLFGHAKPVTSIEFSPDGDLIASGSLDSSVKLWNVKTGRLLKTLRGHWNPVNDVSFDQDGQRIASAAGRWIKVWDADSANEINTLEGHKGRVVSVDFSPDGTQIVSASGADRTSTPNPDDADFTVRLWDSETGEQQLMMRGHSNALISTSFSPDGTRIVSADAKMIMVWDVHTGKQLHVLPNSGVEALFSPDGRRIVAGTKLWDADSGRPLRSGTVDVLCISPDGSHVATRQNSVVRLIDTRNGRELRLFRLLGTATDVAFSPDGRRLAIAGQDQSVRVWRIDQSEGSGGYTLALPGSKSAMFDHGGRQIAILSGTTVQWRDAESGELIRTFDAAQGESTTIRGLSPDGTKIVSTTDAVLKVWDVGSGTIQRELHGHTGTVSQVAFSPDGRLIASADSERTFKVWDVQSGAELQSISKPHSSFSRNIKPSVALSSDGGTLATVGGDNLISLWDVQSGEQLNELRGHSYQVTSLTYSRDGTRIASSSFVDRCIKLWDAKTGNELLSVPTGNYPTQVAFSQDDTRIVAYVPPAIRVWDTETGDELISYDAPRSSGFALASNGARMVFTGSKSRLFDLSDVGLTILRGHVGEISSFAVGPHGNRLVSASDNGTIKLWDLGKKAEVASLRGDRGSVLSAATRVNSVAFSPTGELFASAGTDTTVKMWAAENGKLLKTLKGHGNIVESVSFSADGKQLLSSAHATIFIWDAASGNMKTRIPVPRLGQMNSRRLYVSFTSDGSRVVARERDRGELYVWNSATGQRITDESPVPDFSRTNVSKDGRRLVIQIGDRELGIVDMDLNRRIAAQIDGDAESNGIARHHTRLADAAERVNDDFAAEYHRGWALQYDPQAPRGLPSTPFNKAKELEASADYDAARSMYETSIELLRQRVGDDALASSGYPRIDIHVG